MLISSQNVFLTWITITAEISRNVTSVLPNMAKGGHIGGHIDGYIVFCGHM